MTNESSIRKIVDHILLNACSVNSSGLYNGKAGMALALFEAARYLKDEYIEEQAFDLLQEALIAKTEDISLENGWSTQFIVVFKPLFRKILDYDFKDADTADGVLSAIAKDKMTMYPFVSVQSDFGYSDVTRSNNEISGMVDNLFRKAGYRLNNHEEYWNNYLKMKEQRKK